MKVEQTIQLMTDNYPSLFYNRQTCLNHLFCVIGNGYKWVDGELVDEEDEPYIKEYSKKDIIKAIFDEKNEKTIIEENKKMAEKFKKKYKERTWYPISKEYSYIYNYPKNIKDDWLKALEECKEMLIKDGVNL